MAFRFYIPFRLRRYARKGSTAVEMALLAPIFFLLLIGITEMSLILAAQQLLENAAFNASRLAKTGYTANGSTQAQTVTQLLDNELSGLGALIDTSKITTTETAYTAAVAAQMVTAHKTKSSFTPLLIPGRSSHR
jgi:Flp pilus assembly protein TadG